MCCNSQPIAALCGGGSYAGVDPSALAVASAAQRIERSLSVRQDLALDLPPCLALPDGEERPYGSSTRLRIRDYEQVCLCYLAQSSTSRDSSWFDLNQS